MSRRLRRAGLGILIAGVCWVRACQPDMARAEPIEDATARPPLDILQTAFDRMLNYPSVRSVVLRIHRSGDRVIHRAFDVVYKKVGERGQLLLRFTAPEYLRDTALLIVERGDATSDTWLYHPSARRSRRVSTSQKGDAFFGSDLTIEDLEHRDWRRYALRRLPDAAERGRPCHVIEAVARHESPYARIVAWIEREEQVLLRVDFFRGASEAPLKTLTVETEGLVAEGTLLKPRRMWMRQNGREAATEVEFVRTETDARITDRVFSAMRLERSGQDLFELVERQRAGDAE